MTFKMLPLRQKKLVEAIVGTGFSKNEFDFIPETNESFQISYKKNPQFRMKPGKEGSGQLIYHLCPAEDGKINAIRKPRKFEESVAILKEWLEYLKENVEVGDPWEEFTEIKAILSRQDFDSYEEYFTEGEEEILNQKLDLLSGKLDELNVSNERIKEEIHHLKEMTNKMSRKDWTMLSMGFFVSWFLSGDIDYDFFHDLLNFVENLFSGYRLLTI